MVGSVAVPASLSAWELAEHLCGMAGMRGHGAMGALTVVTGHLMERSLVLMLHFLLVESQQI